MRVLHFSTTDQIGGAGKGAFALHRGLRDLGVDSWMFVQRKRTGEPHVRAPRGRLGLWASYACYVPDALALLTYRGRGDLKFSAARFGWPLHRVIDDLKPDIVQLHWVCSGLASIAGIGRIRQPIVWTLRDLWPFTGGCHYSFGCRRYVNGCGACPGLGSTHEEDLSRRVLEAKLRCWHGLDIHPVGLGTWVADCAQESRLLSHREARVIPNGHDLSMWHPRDRTRCREVLGIRPETKVIVFGAVDPADRVKGMGLLLEALQVLRHRQDLLLLVFGTADLPTVGVECRSLGYVSSQEDLAQIYSAGDVFVAPSLYESFGKTVSEAMSCGTPAVAFDATGPRDIIDHRVNGYLARSYEVEDLAAGIAWVLDHAGSPAWDELSREAVAKVETAFDIRQVCRRYRDLYDSILSS